MNLYVVRFKHYASKDCESGIKTYLVANSDEEVYEWIKSEPKMEKGKRLFNSYEDRECDGGTFDVYDEEYNVVGKEKFKDRMIRLHGEYYDKDVELCDLCCGETLIGWELVKSDISEYDIEFVRNLGISVMMGLGGEVL